jgi:hypothetical protein
LNEISSSGSVSASDRVARLARIPDHKEGSDLNARFAVEVRRTDAVVDRDLLAHELERLLAARLEAEIDPAAAGLLHQP